MQWCVDEFQQTVRREESLHILYAYLLGLIFMFDR